MPPYLAQKSHFASEDISKCHKMALSGGTHNPSFDLNEAKVGQDDDQHF